MDIFRFFKKNKPVLMRCTYCCDEFEFSTREIRLLEKQNAHNTVCSIKEECHMCHIGFMIPVKHTDKHGKQYLFHKIKQKIKNLDPDTVNERIFDHTDPENIFFFGPDD